MTNPSSPKPELPGRVAEYLAEGVLKEEIISLGEVRAIWQKAINGVSDASQPGLTPDGVVSLAYTAQMQAAMAVLWAHGYRGGADPKHHFSLIDAVRAFAKAAKRTAFVEVLNKLDRLRQVRRHSLYESEPVTPEEANTARELMGKMLPAAAEHLQAINPAIVAPAVLPHAPPRPSTGQPRKRHRP
jgi:hypothetical protein